MSLIEDLLERPFDQAITSKYTAMNGLIYLGVGTLVLIWPGMVQTIFRGGGKCIYDTAPDAGPPPAHEAVVASGVGTKRFR
jgi:hypothetical protein